MHWQALCQPVGLMALSSSSGLGRVSREMRNVMTELLKAWYPMLSVICVSSLSICAAEESTQVRVDKLFGLCFDM